MMKNVYGYIRVSTVKQGAGVSLQEQKEAIIRHAEKQELDLVQWFEEKETAAKQGRPQFSKMMKLLQDGKAKGVIIHKIDRGARNLKDWAALGDLIDQGVDVHFAHESLDMNARGGRLAADIQAVIASDYIRNLREEAIKGIYGRIRQGIYPFGAPAGYRNNGSGQLKTIDQIQGPLVKETFTKYSTGKFTLQTLSNVMAQLGLKNTWGNPISINSLSKILQNPFYTGIIKIKGKTFKGGHSPLISSALFNKVQEILKGKTHSKSNKHDFLFRRMIKCNECGYRLTGELQKGHIYYRCHTKMCPTKTIRQDVIDKALLTVFDQIQLHSLESDLIKNLLAETKESWTLDHKQILDSLSLQKANGLAKMERLTDAYIENTIEKELFENKKEKLLIEQQEIESNLVRISVKKGAIFKKASNFFELLKSVKNSYLNGIEEEKRKIVRIVTSNLAVQGKTPMISTRLPFCDMINKDKLSISPLDRDRLRTCTAHYDTPTTSGDKYLNCTEIRASMQELLDMVLKWIEHNPTKINEEEL